MDYINALRVFCCAVESGSFTKAADALGITTAAVSRTISNLEKHLDTRLFNRTTRNISITEAGSIFFDGCSKIILDIDLLEHTASQQTIAPSGVLRIASHSSIVRNRLAPLISEFSKQFPKIKLDIHTTDRPIDLVSEGYDVGLVFPYMITNDSTITKSLERIPLTITASSQYLNAHGTPESPEDLKTHKFIAISPYIRKPRITFVRNSQTCNIETPYDISSNNADFNLSLVIQGGGIGIFPDFMSRQEIRSGKLVEILTDFEIENGEIDLRIAYSSRSFLPAKTRAFIDFSSTYIEGIALTKRSDPDSRQKSSN